MHDDTPPPTASAPLDGERESPRVPPVALTEAVLDQDIDTFGADGEFDRLSMTVDGPA